MHAAKNITKIKDLEVTGGVEEKVTGLETSEYLVKTVLGFILTASS